MSSRPEVVERESARCEHLDPDVRRWGSPTGRRAIEHVDRAVLGVHADRVPGTAEDARPAPYEMLAVEGGPLLRIGSDQPRPWMPAGSVPFEHPGATGEEGEPRDPERTDHGR